MSVSSTTSTLPLVNVVLDLDRVLIDILLDKEECIRFFLRKGAIFTINKTYAVFPGVREFLTLLHRTPQIRESFFSAGEKTRNEAVVDHLWKLVFSENKPPRAKILSRGDLVETREKDHEVRAAKYGFACKKQSKDISKVLEENEKLEDSLLIENSKEYAASGQENNLLYVPSSECAYFDLLRGANASNMHFYMPTLPSFLTKKASEQLSDEINITQTDKGFDIHFLDNTTFEKRNYLVPQNEYPQLVMDLNSLFADLNASDTPFLQITRSKSAAQITDIVTKLGGKSRKICHEANRIYYIVGQLFSSFEASQQQQIPITDILFWRQFLKVAEDRYDFAGDNCAQCDNLYIDGLRRLKQINPSLEFITPSSYQQIVSAPLSVDERRLLRQGS